jgi:hypothetical protein
MEVSNNGQYPNANGTTITPGTYLSMPIMAGTIPNSSGTTLAGLGNIGGVNCYSNAGFAPLAQSAVVTQASGVTNIVVPAQSQILAIYLMVTTAWTGAASTLGVGSTASATAFTAAAAVTASALGQLIIATGTGATQIGNWDNVGNTDVKIQVTSANTGSGVGTLTVFYIPGINNAS